MNRSACVLWLEQPAGYLKETDEGYHFQYLKEYLDDPSCEAVSLTLPLRQEPFISKTMFSFFDGLIPEGWLLDVVQTTWKVDPRDRMGLLLACCKDCIGAVSIVQENESE